MAQEYILLAESLIETEEQIHEALTKCKTCTKIVPKTMLCLYCGSPILFRHPEPE